MVVLLLLGGSLGVAVFIVYLVAYYFKPDINIISRHRARSEDWCVVGTIKGKDFKAWGRGHAWNYSYPTLGPCPLRVSLSLADSMKKLDAVPNKCE